MYPILRAKGGGEKGGSRCTYSYARPIRGRRSWFQALARRHCRRRLCGGFSNRLVTCSHRASLRRARVRRHAYLCEERCAGLFERIFVYWTGLAHLGLLISSFFISQPAAFRAVHLFKFKGRRGLELGALDQIVSYCVHRLSITVGRKHRSDLP